MAVAARELIDITVPLTPGLPASPGVRGVRVVRDASIGAGAPANVSRIEMGAHIGTHVDAPSHVHDGAAGSEALSLDALVGPAWVADARACAGRIGADDLAALDVPPECERLLLATTNSELWQEESGAGEHVRLAPGAAAWLADRGIRLVGLDYVAIGCPQTREALMDAGVMSLEGLDLSTVEPGPYELLCLPLAIRGSDGAPARALLRPL